MKSLRLFLIVGAIGSLMLPSLVAAQWDLVGIYADTDASTQNLIGPENVPFSAYVVLTEPTNPLIWGFEFGYTIEVGDPATMFRLQNVLPPEAVDIGDNTNLLQGDYVVGLATPLLAQQAVVLVSWQFMMTAPQVAYLSLGPSNIPSLPYDLPAYEIGGTIVAMELAASCWGTEVRVNEHCPLPVENQAFGAVKALYR